MDALDRAILNEIQADFPVEPHPYRVIGSKLGINEKEVLDRIARLRKEGIIRRLGASINSRQIGFVSTLLAAKVPPDKFDMFVKIVNECPGVTHNYERRHEYNVWFTLIAPSISEKRSIIDELVEKTGVKILELPATRIFKIRVDFRF
jgi:DNA-binding Lrp family transcriptional regulator